MSTVYILDNQEEYSYHCVAFVRVDLEVWPNFEALAEVFGWAIHKASSRKHVGNVPCAKTQL